VISVPESGKNRRPKLDPTLSPETWTVTNDRMFRPSTVFAQNWNPGDFSLDELDQKNFDPKDE